MDILFGDPFYHNIIHHLLPKDLHNLKCSCKHFKNTITKNFIKEVTLRNVKDELKNVLGDNYNRFKEYILQLDREIIQPSYMGKSLTKYNEYLKANNKYNTHYIIVFKKVFTEFGIYTDLYKECKKDRFQINEDTYFCDCSFTGITSRIKEYYWGDNCFEFNLYAINKDTTKIKRIEARRPSYDDSFYYFEHDTTDYFKLSYYL
jgi:hypothetical protein